MTVVCWLVLCTIGVLLLCSYRCTREQYNDYNRACDTGMASRMASLGSKFKYTCLNELQTGSRIIRTDHTHTKNIGIHSAKALGNSHASVERNNARHQQNREVIASTRINANDLSRITTGKLNSPNSNTYAATTGGKTTQEQLREQQTEINTLKASIKALGGTA